MDGFTRAAMFFIVVIGISGQAQATIISVTDINGSFRGGYASIISAPGDVREDAAYNIAQQGFDEKHGVTLSRRVRIDGGWIKKGTLVDSHMIFLNTGPGNSRKFNKNFGVEWLFDGPILGVMSKKNGKWEVKSTGQLGLNNVIYPTSTFPLRGMEPKDSYSVNGSLITVNMRVTEPGDWIRVVTQTQTVTVPEPSIPLLMGLGLFALSVQRRRYRTKHHRQPELTAIG